MSTVDRLKELLKEELAILKKSEDYLAYSLRKCQSIELGRALSDEDYESLDSFASRFMRCYEVLINQVLRTVLEIFGERKDTFLDNLYLAEKLELITSVEHILDLRKLRNIVAHEYAVKDWIAIYSNLIVLSEKLMQNVKLLKAQIEKRIE